MKTILLADDSITIQKVVELTFSEADYRVVCVSSGGQALKKVSEVRPDIILLDLNLPDMSGYEVLRTLRVSKVKTPFACHPPRTASTIPPSAKPTGKPTTPNKASVPAPASSSSPP